MRSACNESLHVDTDLKTLQLNQLSKYIHAVNNIRGLSFCEIPPMAPYSVLDFRQKGTFNFHENMKKRG